MKTLIAVLALSMASYAQDKPPAEGERPRPPR